MASLGSLMFVLTLSFYVTNCKTSLEENAFTAEPKIPRIVGQLINLAQRHLESERLAKQTVVNVRRMQETKVDACFVRYRLWTDIAPTNCDSASGCDPNTHLVSKCVIDYLNNECPRSTWFNPYLHITANNCTVSQKFPHEVDSKVARSNDPKAINPNDPGVLDWLDASLEAMNKVRPDKNLSILHAALSAIRKGNGGWNLIATIVLSKCARNDHKDPMECEPLHAPDNSPQLCHFDISEPMGHLKLSRIVHISCEGDEQYSLEIEAGPRQGGRRRVDTYDPQLKNILEASVHQLDAHSPHIYKYMITEVLQAFEQVVSGLVWQVKAEIALSSTIKDENIRLGVIPIEASRRICYFKIWDQPWLPSLESEVKCEKPDKVIPYPPEMEIDPQSPKVLRLIAESLKRYNSESHWSNEFILYRSTEAHRKDLGAGNLEWMITALIDESDCVKQKNRGNRKRCLPKPYGHSELCLFGVRESLTGISEIQSKCVPMLKSHDKIDNE